MKTCSKCKEEKSLVDFYKDKSKVDNLHSWCKDCLKLSNKNWQSNNKEKVISNNRNWQRKNPDKIYQYVTKWNNKNKEKRRNSDNKRRTIVAGSNSFFISKKEIKKIYESPCFNCGSVDNISIDHIIPISKGGKHSVGNIQALCRSCNSSKHNKFMIEWKNMEKK